MFITNEGIFLDYKYYPIFILKNDGNKIWKIFQIILVYERIIKSILSDFENNNNKLGFDLFFNEHFIK